MDISNILAGLGRGLPESVAAYNQDQTNRGKLMLDEMNARATAYENQKKREDDQIKADQEALKQTILDMATQESQFLLEMMNSNPDTSQWGEGATNFHREISGTLREYIEGLNSKYGRKVFSTEQHVRELDSKVKQPLSEAAKKRQAEQEGQAKGVEAAAARAAGPQATPLTPDQRAQFQVPAGTPAFTQPTGTVQIETPPTTNITTNVGPQGIDYGDPPKDMAWKRDPGGKVLLDENGAPMAVPVRGGPMDLKLQADKEAARIKQAGEITRADIVVQDINRAIAKIDANPRSVTGWGALLAVFPETEARNVAGLIETAKSNVAFDRLQAMRDASPTGGALGQVSIYEVRLLQGAIGNLEQAQTAEQLRFNLERVRDLYSLIVHGADVSQRGDDAGIPPAPAGVAPADWPALWQTMTPAERALWQN